MEDNIFLSQPSRSTAVLSGNGVQSDDVIGYWWAFGCTWVKSTESVRTIALGGSCVPRTAWGSTAGTKIDQIGTVSTFDCTISPTTGPLRRGTRVCGDPARNFGVHSRYLVGD